MRSNPNYFEAVLFWCFVVVVVVIDVVFVVVYVVLLLFLSLTFILL